MPDMARILIAEDDESMLNFLSLALERAGHETVSAKNGTDALTALEKNDTFDILLTDIVMPGIDGIELSTRAKEIHPSIEIMLITGFAAMAMKHAEEAENTNTQMLSKPFHLNDLVEKVEDLLKNKLNP